MDLTMYTVDVQLIPSLVSFDSLVPTTPNTKLIYSPDKDECPGDALGTDRVIGHIRRAVAFHSRLHTLGRIITFRDLTHTTTLEEIVRNATSMYEDPERELSARFLRPAAPSEDTQAFTLDMLVPHDHGRPKSDNLPRLTIRSVTNDGTFTLRDMHTTGHDAAIYSRNRNLTTNPATGHFVLRMSEPFFRASLFALPNTGSYSTNLSRCHNAHPSFTTESTCEPSMRRRPSLAWARYE